MNTRSASTCKIVAGNHLFSNRSKQSQSSPIAKACGRCNHTCEIMMRGRDVITECMKCASDDTGLQKRRRLTQSRTEIRVSRQLQRIYIPGLLAIAKAAKRTRRLSSNSTCLKIRRRNIFGAYIDFCKICSTTSSLSAARQLKWHTTTVNSSAAVTTVAVETRFRKRRYR